MKEETNQASAPLLSEEELFRFMVESLGDYAILTTDGSNRIVSWNPGAARIFGYNEAEISGQNAAILFTPEDRERGEAVESLRAQSIEKQVKLEADFVSEPLVVKADPLRLQQIIWNLVTNAVKFTPAGGRVSVALSRADDKAQLVVADTGEGIDPTFLSHVFEMFRQADASTTRQHGGMGIGLVLVSQLAELHGGRAAAHSEGRGRGAQFTVWLPLHSAAPVAETPVPQALASEGKLAGGAFSSWTTHATRWK